MKLSNSRSHNGRWQTLALPVEHGAWAFISEPIILGLLLAPSFAGLLLTLAAFAAFLLRQPLKILLKDLRAERNVPRTRTAWRFVMIYGNILLLAGIVTLLIAPSPLWLVPLALSSPLIVLQLWHDLDNQSRKLMAELAGVLASGAFASSIVLMRDWTLIAALGLWLALAVKGDQSKTGARQPLGSKYLAHLNP